MRKTKTERQTDRQTDFSCDLKMHVNITYSTTVFKCDNHLIFFRRFAILCIFRFTNMEPSKAGRNCLLF
jgi:hypothetical protein